jgi:hypothetical protein
MSFSAMHKRLFIIGAIIGCLAVVTTFILGLWFLLDARPGRPAGGGTASIGDTTVHYVQLGPDGRIGLVVWSDLSGAGGQKSESDLFKSTTAGFVSSPDGRRVDWEWKGSREKSGDFQINGSAYDLANGTLFLVSTTRGQVQVTQLDVDLSNIKPGKQGLEAFANNQPKVAQFISEASAPK